MESKIKSDFLHCYLLVVHEVAVMGDTVLCNSLKNQGHNAIAHMEHNVSLKLESGTVYA